MNGWVSFQLLHLDTAIFLCSSLQTSCQGAQCSGMNSSVSPIWSTLGCNSFAFVVVLVASHTYFYFIFFSCLVTQKIHLLILFWGHSIYKYHWLRRKIITQVHLKYYLEQISLLWVLTQSHAMSWHDHDMVIHQMLLQDRIRQTNASYVRRFWGLLFHIAGVPQSVSHW